LNLCQNSMHCYQWTSITRVLEINYTKIVKNQGKTVPITYHIVINKVDKMLSLGRNWQQKILQRRQNMCNLQSSHRVTKAQLLLRWRHNVTYSMRLPISAYWCTAYLAPFLSYCAAYVLVKCLHSSGEYLSLTHSFSVIFENISMSHVLPETRFCGIHFVAENVCLSSTTLT